MSIEQFFPAAKSGGFLASLGGGSKENYGGHYSSSTNATGMAGSNGGKNNKHVGIPSINTLGVGNSSSQKSEVKKEYRSMDRVLRNEYEHPFSKKGTVIMALSQSHI